MEYKPKGRTERIVSQSVSAKGVSLGQRKSADEEADFDENDMDEQDAYRSPCTINTDALKKTLITDVHKPRFESKFKVKTGILTNRIPRTPGFSDNKRLIDMQKALTPGMTQRSGEHIGSQDGLRQACYLMRLSKNSHSGEPSEKLTSIKITAPAEPPPETDPISEESDQYDTARSHMSKPANEGDEEAKLAGDPEWLQVLNRSIVGPRKVASLKQRITTKKAEFERKANTIRNTLKNDI